MGGTRDIFRLALVAAAALMSMSAPVRGDQTELTDAVQLHAGTTAAWVLTSAGGVKCWGSGYVGDGSQGRGAVAGDVLGLTSGVVALGMSKGDNHTQGHICAVLASGGVKCWGGNYYGQLGDGTNSVRATPVDVIRCRGPRSQLPWANPTPAPCWRAAASIAGATILRVSSAGMRSRAARGPRLGREPHVRNYLGRRSHVLGPEPPGPAWRRHYHEPLHARGRAKPR
jgi:hypothetical protein